MAQYEENTSSVVERLGMSDLSADTSSAIENLLNAGDSEGNTAIQDYDGTQPDSDTTVLRVGAGQSLTGDPGTPVIIMDSDAPAAQVTLDAGTGQDRLFVGGGGDDNINITGTGNTIIETGGGNDVIVGGSGTETVVITGSGNSSVSTGDGNDTIRIAGDGAPTVDAGDGNDTIVLETDQGMATVDGGNGFDQALMNDSRDNHNFTVQDGIVVMESAPTQIGNVEVVQFEDSISVIADNSTEASLARMYEVMFDREADLGGLDFWFGRAEAGDSLEHIANAMAASDEFEATYNEIASEDVFLETLYQNAFGREADEGGKAYWLEQMSDGMTQAQVAQSFALSVEAVELMGIDGTQYVIDVDNSQ